MAAFKQSADSELISEINVTPFVDVVLVLLIIFMSTSTVIIRTALDLEIPHAANARSMKQKTILSLVLKQNKSLELNGKSIEPAALVRQLTHEVKNRRDDDTTDTEPVQVLISANGNHRYQDVVDLIDKVKGAGVMHVALNTLLLDDGDSPQSR